MAKKRSHQEAPILNPFAPQKMRSERVRIFSTEKADYLGEYDFTYQPITGGTTIDSRLIRVEKK
jgi:hypothetical protein